MSNYLHYNSIALSVGESSRRTVVARCQCSSVECGSSAIYHSVYFMQKLKLCGGFNECSVDTVVALLIVEMQNLLHLEVSAYSTSTHVLEIRSKSTHKERLKY